MVLYGHQWWNIRSWKRLGGGKKGHELCGIVATPLEIVTRNQWAFVWSENISPFPFVLRFRFFYPTNTNCENPRGPTNKRGKQTKNLLIKWFFSWYSSIYIYKYKYIYMYSFEPLLKSISILESRSMQFQLRSYSIFHVLDMFIMRKKKVFKKMFL